MKKTLKIIIKIICFALIFSILLTNVTLVLCQRVDKASYNNIRGFYDEPKNSLDAVYIGSSSVKCYWNSLLAWQEYGITVYSFSANALPLASVEFMIKEARKTQPNAKFLVNINSTADVADPPGLYRVFDYTPPSINKLFSINQICNRYDLPLSKQLEYYFPIIPFHSRWNSLNYQDFDLSTNGFKGSVYSKKDLFYVTDLTKNYNYYDGETELSSMLQESVDSLLNYCDKENLDVTFITVPQSKPEKEIGKYNAINKIIADRGYPVLNLMDKTEEIPLRFEKDFYNYYHTNIHGSIKYTHYLANYLIDTYDFKDKRQDENYQYWNDSLERYWKEIDCSVLDFTVSAKYDDTCLAEPENLTAVPEKDKITISWQAVPEAEGYVIYEKLGNRGTWTKVDQTSDLSYVDTKFKDKEEYYYTVVPYKTIDGEKAYGDYCRNGITVIAKTHSNDK